MARIQIVPLPTQKLGDFERTPFILILDQVSRFDEDFPNEWLDELKERTGAAAVVAHEATLDAPGSIELSDEQREELLEQLTSPAKYVADQRYTDAEERITRARARMSVTG